MPTEFPMPELPASPLRDGNQVVFSAGHMVAHAVAARWPLEQEIARLDGERNRLAVQGADTHAALASPPTAAVQRQEPAGYVYVFGSPFGGTHWSLSSNQWSGQRPRESRPFWFEPVAALSSPAPQGEAPTALQLGIQALWGTPREKDAAEVAMRAALAAPATPEPEVEALRSVLTRLLKSFPTDTDMEAAGWEPLEIQEACNANDAARAALRQAPVDGGA